jgi:hypothetical protein
MYMPWIFFCVCCKCNNDEILGALSESLYEGPFDSCIYSNYIRAYV